MKKILVLSTSGAGGDLQPLIAVALGLRERGHQLVFFGDQSVVAALQDPGIETVVSLPEHDLGPRLIAAIRDAQALEPSAQGGLVQQRLAAWAADFAPDVQRLIQDQKPDLLLTSIFGVGVAHLATLNSGLPWCVVNSTFYVGPNPPRDPERDFAPRAVPLFRYFAPILGQAGLVLHATDQVFDYGYTGLPPTHHYVGPLIWEAAAPVPRYLDEPGDPWVLVTLSSQLQDDVPLAELVLQALGHQPLRVLLTIGTGHQLAELKHVPVNFKVEQYIPHSRVLERSRLIVSHAGHGAVMKALWYGVPMVLVPWGRDQPGVAARAERLGVAQVIARNELTRERLADAVKAVLEDGQMQAAARATSQRLRAQNPVAIACDLLEQI